MSGDVLRQSKHCPTEEMRTSTMAKKGMKTAQNCSPTVRELDLCFTKTRTPTTLPNKIKTRNEKSKIVRKNYRGNLWPLLHDSFKRLVASPPSSIKTGIQKQQITFASLVRTFLILGQSLHLQLNFSVYQNVTQIPSLENTGVILYFIFNCF